MEDRDSKWAAWGPSRSKSSCLKHAVFGFMILPRVRQQGVCVSAGRGRGSNSELMVHGQ
jgi:hypothetical protein